MYGYMGGGELLRAVMDDVSLHRQYTIYNGFLNACSAVVNQTAILRGTFQCRPDRWFLMTGVFPIWATQNTGPNARDFKTLNGNEFITFADGANRREAVNNPILRLQIGLMNEALNARMTLPEYLLWSPNSLIDFSWQGITDQQANGVSFKCLCLEGIEYLLP